MQLGQQRQGADDQVADVRVLLRDVQGALGAAGDSPPPIAA
jgi:hypothetical protein